MKRAIETYLQEARAMVAGLDAAEIEKAAAQLFDVLWNVGTVFICGNGGSAATASHFANDLNKYCSVPNLPAFRALALTDNVPLLTAVANDMSYASVFVEPLRHWLKAGDLVVGISASGNSNNVLAAIEYANMKGALTLGLCGAPGGQLADLVQVRVIIPSNQIGPQEDGHLLVTHCLSYALRERLVQIATA
jgi:D-sedoheptulose 7-phosphate isomerase